ncbi:MBOAT family O-acyltransferase [Christiangramia flava]|uniref:Putative poly(Beta-D-mannuronate) O-acetylase n=1 Tax=Christiangramia flava JLT2011 TaxID=1229726 RepID=A0A1L7I728_9FLAO|nr:MBOAT family O-acyltransferase [Christiangramia flava]APU69396.1 putative poly(beta-D-mannuronate) O-acetylase [Christiangramia flava JLT2011]OSS37719.1 poly(beta-D-mannuronate) O-acetylase [Christiangramia flava JLT2011]
MLFNSFNYLYFLPLVFITYWALSKFGRKKQNLFLLIASYFFYGLWDFRFLGLLFFSSIVDFYAAQKIFKADNKEKKKLFILFSLFWNLGILFVFKYFNFFVNSFSGLFSLKDGYHFQLVSIIIPVGLSFYTFQTLSYSIDVYKGKIKPTDNLIEFLCFVSFFPQLVAGPIERASSLLPQFLKNRRFSYENLREGLRQILWGLFKKMVIADNIAIAVNTIFDTPSSYQSTEIFYGLTLFYFQIYCDFSGYADIAIGSARLLGFKLSVNFRTPHFSHSIPEFWRKWNITVSTWFRDYIFLPLAKKTNRSEKSISAVTLLTFFLIGLWHGANWTFIFFGLFHGIFMIVYRYISLPTKKKFKLKWHFFFIDSLFILFCFFLLVISSAFFRASDIETSFFILKRLFSFIPDPNFETIIGLKSLFIIPLIIIEFFTKNLKYPLEALENRTSRIFRWSIYYLLIFMILRYGGPQESFIYFQF